MVFRQSYLADAMRDESSSPKSGAWLEAPEHDLVGAMEGRNP